jgi:hypothetical protein
LDELAAGAAPYYPACCRELFDASRPPLLSYLPEDMDRLAAKVVRQHVAVPGVQPKLSLHLEREARKGAGRFTIVGLEGGYILKPPVSRYPEMPDLAFVPTANSVAWPGRAVRRDHVRPGFACHDAGGWSAVCRRSGRMYWAVAS